MAVDTETLENVVSSYVADVKSAMQIDRAYLFGSYAKGLPRQDSDIDLCFFSNSFEGKCPFELTTQLLKIARKYVDFGIEPHVFPTSELQNDNPFVKEILRTGREL